MSMKGQNLDKELENIKTPELQFGDSSTVPEFYKEITKKYTKIIELLKQISQTNPNIKQDYTKMLEHLENKPCTNMQEQMDMYKELLGIEEELRKLFESEETITKRIKDKISSCISYFKNNSSKINISELVERIKKIREEINNYSQTGKFEDIRLILQSFTELQCLLIAIYTRKTENNPYDNLENLGLITGDEELNRICTYIRGLDLDNDANLRYYLLNYDNEKLISTRELWDKIADYFNIPLQVEIEELGVVKDENNTSLAISTQPKISWISRLFQKLINLLKGNKLPDENSGKKIIDEHLKVKKTVYEQLREEYKKNGAVSFLRKLGKANLREIGFPSDVLKQYEKRLLELEKGNDRTTENSIPVFQLKNDEELWIILNKIVEKSRKAVIAKDEENNEYEVQLEGYNYCEIKIVSRPSNEEILLCCVKEVGDYYNGKITIDYARRSTVEDHLVNIKIQRFMNEIDFLFGTNLMMDYIKEILNKSWKGRDNKKYLKAGTLEIFEEARDIKRKIHDISNYELHVIKLLSRREKFYEEQREELQKKKQELEPEQEPEPEQELEPKQLQAQVTNEMSSGKSKEIEKHNNSPKQLLEEEREL